MKKFNLILIFLLLCNSLANAQSLGGSQFLSIPLPVAQGGTGATALPTRSFTAPANPVGTASSSYVMLGLGGSFTPTVSTKLIAMITGDQKNLTANNGCSYNFRYGTGTSPANGAAPSGTSFGAFSAVYFPTINAGLPLSFSSIATGLTVGTTYWVDLSFSNTSAGTCQLGNTSLIMFE